MKLVDPCGSGPQRKFGDAHVFYALHLIGRGRISRAALASEMGIGEGSMRKILDVLGSWKMVVVEQQGISLSENGYRFLREIPMDVVQVKPSKYVVGVFQGAVLVRGVADQVTNGMYQRDCGIIAGADGTSVFKMVNGALIMPKQWNMDEMDPLFARNLRQTGIRDGDVLIISGSSDPAVAVLASISAGLDML